MRGFAADLAATGAVRPDRTLDEIADILWPALDVRAYDWLVRRQGWPVEHYLEWYVTSVLGAITTA